MRLASSSHPVDDVFEEIKEDYEDPREHLSKRTKKEESKKEMHSEVKMRKKGDHEMSVADSRMGSLSGDKGSGFKMSVFG
jgi:hypothetical protein